MTDPTAPIDRVRGLMTAGDLAEAERVADASFPAPGPLIVAVLNDRSAEGFPLVPYLRQHAEGGATWAQAWLGTSLVLLLGDRIDEDEARSWRERAATAGHPHALLHDGLARSGGELDARLLQAALDADAPEDIGIPWYGGGPWSAELTVSERAAAALGIARSLSSDPAAERWFQRSLSAGPWFEYDDEDTDLDAALTLAEWYVAAGRTRLAAREFDRVISTCDETYTDEGTRIEEAHKPWRADYAEATARLRARFTALRRVLATPDLSERTPRTLVTLASEFRWFGSDGPEDRAHAETAFGSLRVADALARRFGVPAGGAPAGDDDTIRTLIAWFDEVYVARLERLVADIPDADVPDLTSVIHSWPRIARLWAQIGLGHDPGMQRVHRWYHEATGDRPFTRSEISVAIVAAGSRSDWDELGDRIGAATERAVASLLAALPAPDADTRLELFADEVRDGLVTVTRALTHGAPAGSG